MTVRGSRLEQHDGERARPRKRSSARPNLSAGMLTSHRGKRSLEPCWSTGRTVLAQQGQRRLVDPEREIGASDDPERTACREFAEAFGVAASIASLQPWERSASAVQACDRLLRRSRFRHDVAGKHIFEIDWPSKSDRSQAFPEATAEWFGLETARSKVLSGEIDLIDRLEKVSTQDD